MNIYISIKDAESNEIMLTVEGKMDVLAELVRLLSAKMNTGEFSNIKIEESNED